MRALIGLAVLSAASLLQGCTALSAGISLEFDRQHRADATTTGPDTAVRLPAPGDMLTLHLADGRTVRGAFVSLPPDSLALDVGTFALGDTERVVRPWKRGSLAVPLVLGALADVAVLLLLSRITYDFSGLTLN